MKPRHWLRSLLVPAGAALLAGCATSSPLSRIDANRQIYESWPIEVQQAVLDGRVEKGMTPDQVRMAVGNPSATEVRPARGGDEEVWIYRKGGGGSVLPKNTGITLGVGGVYVGGSGSGSGAIEDERVVVFKKGVVVRSDFGG